MEDIPLLLKDTYENRIRYQLDVTQDLPRFSGDPEQIEAVVDQLVNNACTAIPDDGELTVSIRLEDIEEEEDVLHEPVKPGTYMVFTFSDTGPGIPEELRDRIFEPFFTTKPFGTASGLGLPFVLGVLRGHGGFLRMSDVPGGGLSVSACFPLPQG
ncbi:MAG: ATP-binding protein [Kiritimatiellae bacterium]|nr:ATP-binding protein [Kiritimatiellia bacterium]